MAKPVTSVSERSEFERAVEEGLPITLKTGREVEMTFVELSRLVAEGKVPTPMTAIVARELFPEEAKTPEDKLKQYLEGLQVAKLIAENVLKKQYIGLFDEEYFEIYDLSNHPAMALSRFRNQQAKRVGSVSELPEVGTDTQPETQS